MKNLKTVIAAALMGMSSVAAVAGTSSIDFIECQTAAGKVVADLSIETSLDERYAINVFGTLKLGVFEINLDAPIASQQFVAAGGGGYAFNLGEETVLTAWPEEPGASLAIALGADQNLYLGQCSLNEQGVRKLFRIPS